MQTGKNQKKNGAILPLTGICYFWHPRGWGFVLGDDKQRYFCCANFIHQAERSKGVMELSIGDVVEFLPSKNDRGLAARNIKVVGGIPLSFLKEIRRMLYNE